MPMNNTELNKYDSNQVKMMNENCIIVDKNDKIVGFDSKINCHINEGKLHRAFSVLLFNSNNELLIQQRATKKITFPSIWANSCCSHPLYLEDERNEIKGARIAVKRKMEQELGINKKNINNQKLHFITKMHYKARADRKWIEHEIDYIFVIKDNLKINPNANEIEQTRYINKEDLDYFFKNAERNGDKIGPWFKLIKDNFLEKIWENIDNLENVVDNKLHNMGEC